GVADPVTALPPFSANLAYLCHGPLQMSSEFDVRNIYLTGASVSSTTQCASIHWRTASRITGGPGSQSVVWRTAGQVLNVLSAVAKSCEISLQSFRLTI